jgi:hypothetical protein
MTLGFRRCHRSVTFSTPDSVQRIEDLHHSAPEVPRTIPARVVSHDRGYRDSWSPRHAREASKVLVHGVTVTWHPPWRAARHDPHERIVAYAETGRKRRYRTLLPISRLQSADPSVWISSGRIAPGPFEVGPNAQEVAFWEVAAKSGPRDWISHRRLHLGKRPYLSAYG